VGIPSDRTRSTSFQEDYFYNAILWAVNKKITTGTSETEFSPNRNSYRAEIVTFLYRELKDVI
jgi:hypothetical protein